MRRRPPIPTLFPYTTLFRSLEPIVRVSLSGDHAPVAADARVLDEKVAVPHSRPVPFFHPRSEEHTSELQSQSNLVCRLLLEKKKFAVRDQYAPYPSESQRVS